MTISLISRLGPSAGVGILFVLAVGCNGDRNGEWASSLSETQQETIKRWLFCDDCTDAMRADVQALGDPAVEPLADALKGPPAEWRSNMRTQFGEAANDLGLSPTDSAAYVARYLANFDASAQSRSAWSLGDIDTPASVQALRDALGASRSPPYRSDVLRAIHEALVTAELAEFDGQLSPDSTPAFLDTVVVRQGTLAWDGDESVSLNGAPFPDDLVVRRWTTDSLGFLAVGETGRYALSVTNIGPGQAVRRVPLTITSFPGPAELAPRSILPGLTLPQTIFLSLSQSTNPADTLRYYRFQPAANTTVTATVEWRNDARIDLIWNACENVSVPGLNPGFVSGTVVDETGAPLSGVTMTLLGTSVGTFTDGLGRFDLPALVNFQGDVRAQRAGLQTVTLPTREGTGAIWIVMRVAPAPAAFTPIVEQSPSPNSATLTIPGGSCRILGLQKSDNQVSSVIARLRLTSP